MWACGGSALRGAWHAVAGGHWQRRGGAQRAVCAAHACGARNRIARFREHCTSFPRRPAPPLSSVRACLREISSPRVFEPAGSSSFLSNQLIVLCPLRISVVRVGPARRLLRPRNARLHAAPGSRRRVWRRRVCVRVRARAIAVCVCRRRRARALFVSARAARAARRGALRARVCAALRARGGGVAV